MLLLASVVPARGIDALDRAQNLYDHTEYKEATTVLRQGSLENDARALALLGRCYFMQTDYKKATETLERAAALDPKSASVMLWLGRAYGRRAETSFPLAAIGLAGKARQALEKAVQLDPHSSEAVDDLFEYYLQAPGIVGGGLDKARGLMPLIAQNNPAEVHFATARIAEEQKQFDTAEAQLRRAIQLTPNKIGRRLDLAAFLAKRGRFDESEKVFDQAEQVAPGTPRILFERAKVYIDAKRNLELAKNLLNKYLGAPNLTPDDPPRSEALLLLRKAQGN